MYLGKDLAKDAMQKYAIFVIDEDDYSVAAANELRDLLFSCPSRAMTRLVQFLKSNSLSGYGVPV